MRAVRNPQSPLRLHHVGLLAADLDKMVKQLSTSFALRVESPVIEDHEQAAKVQFLRAPGADHWTEVIAPLTADSHLWNALQRRQSLHHQCYESSNAPRLINQLRRSGWIQISPSRPGAAFGGRPITWLINDANLLVEVVEAGAGPRSLAELDCLNRETADA